MVAIQGPPAPEQSTLEDIKKKMLQKYLTNLRLQQGLQPGRENLATLGRFAAGMDEAASMMGGTKPSVQIPAQARTFESRAAAGRKALGGDIGGIGLDPKVLSRLKGGLKDKPPKLATFTDQFGIEWRLPTDPTTGMMQKDFEKGEISKYPNVEKLRKSISDEYQKKMKFHANLSRVYSNAVNLARQAQAKEQRGEIAAADDHALIKLFEKMLDPTSVVREGEFREAQKIGGMVSRIANYWDTVIVGQQKLPPEGRKAIIEAITTIYQASVNQAVPDINKKYQAITQRLTDAGLDIDFETMIKERMTPIQSTTPQQPKARSTIGSQVGSKIKVRGVTYEKIKPGDDRDQGTWQKLGN